jgi:hypothetical protein
LANPDASTLSRRVAAVKCAAHMFEVGHTGAPRIA